LNTSSATTSKLPVQNSLENPNSVLGQNERNGIRNASKLAKVKRMKTAIITTEKKIRGIRNHSPRLKRLHREGQEQSALPC
jgi:uncharacterized protein with von Willebrand factor type A (vWA) domain